MTPRHAMQTLGTEWGRDLIHADLWISLWASRAKKIPKVVTDDVRFVNEANAIHDLGGVIILIDRPDSLPIDDTHASEVIDFGVDFTVVNDGSIEDLCSDVWNIVKESK